MQQGNTVNRDMGASAVTAVFLMLVTAAFSPDVRGATAGARAAELASSPALQPALTQLKAELALTDQQSAQAARLIGSRVSRIEAAVESFGDVSFDSVVDILVEARSVKDEFIPELQGLLTAEQKAKLGQLPKNHDVYVSAMAGWITEGRLKKLSLKVRLTDAQIPQVRAVLLDQARDAVTIVEGLASGDGGKKKILDAVVDLRGVVRQGERKIQPLLSAEQKTALEAYHADSARKEQKDNAPK